MKAVKSIVAILLLVSMVLMFAACTAKPSGTYENKIGGKIKFSGNKFVYTPLLGGQVEGKFEMDGENIKVKWENEDNKGSFDAAKYDKDNDSVTFLGMTFTKD